MTEGENWVIYSPVYVWNIDYKVEVVYNSMAMLWALLVKADNYLVEYKFTDELMSEMNVSDISHEVVGRVADQVEMPREAAEYLVTLVERAFGLDTGR